jgi:valyl-tRNA synthetase
LMRDLLKLFHPVIPFITEELWNELKLGDGLLAGSSWPVVPPYQAPEGVEMLQELVTGIRRFRAEHNLPPRTPLSVTVSDAEGFRGGWWEEQLRSLAWCETRFEAPPSDLAGYARLVAGTVQGFIPLAGLIDVDAERIRLKRSIDKVRQDLSVVETKLSNDDFRAKAPAAVVEKEATKRDDLLRRLDKLLTQLEELGD